MKVTVSVLGRFHAFYLADQLARQGNLLNLITSYPQFETAKYGIPGNLTTSLPFHEGMRRLWHKVPGALKGERNLQYWLNDRFDRRVAHLLNAGGDIFVGWSGASLHSMQAARKFGALTTVERGSSHIAHQRDILEEEYATYGHGESMIPHPATVEKELEEYEFADLISIPSSYVRQTFIERGIPDAKLIQTPYGVDLGSFKQLPREDETFRVVFAGKMTLRKGVHYLLRAFTELNLPRAELWLIGDQTSEITPYLRKYSHKNIRLIGKLRQAELHKYYSQCSIFAICSIEEGLAMVQPQAMACGLPLICTANSGGADLIEDGKHGFVIPIRDVEALKEKITHLYEQREQCHAMGQAARAHVRTGLTWDNYGVEKIKQYQAALDKRSI